MKITLLGDSIRLFGYGTRVPQLLPEDFALWQPEDNCRYSKYTLRGILWEWKAEMAGSDIIHWNNGLWDSCDLGDGPFTSLEEYKATVLRIAARLQEQARVVIFATTTPVKPANPHNNNPLIEAYNAAVVPELRKMGILINDLYALVAPDLEGFLLEDNIHLSEAGIHACAEQVARSILDAAKTL